jgi:hypothetical protein
VVAIVASSASLELARIGRSGGSAVLGTSLAELREACG